MSTILALDWQVLYISIQYTIYIIQQTPFFVKYQRLPADFRDENCVADTVSKCGCSQFVGTTCIYSKWSYLSKYTMYGARMNVRPLHLTRAYVIYRKHYQ